MTSRGNRRRRSNRKVDAADLKKPKLAPFQPRKEVDSPPAEAPAAEPVVEVDRVLAAREAAEKVAFDRSKMAPLPTLKERPPSREVRQRSRDRKARAKRQSTLKGVVLPFSIILALILVAAVSWVTYTRREKIVEAPERGEGGEGGARYVDDYPAVREQNEAAWKQKRERLLATPEEGEKAAAGGRDVEAELVEKEVARRKRELLGVDAPFSEVFRDKNALPDSGD
jgi:hypothetical protein